MKFNLFILIGVVFSLVVLPMVVASEAKISYAVANKPVVYDIPFSVNVLADTKDFPKDKPPITVPILEYGVTVTSDTSKALFQSHSKSDPATLNAKTGSLDTNTKYRVFTDSSGNSWTPATLFTVGVKFTGNITETNNGCWSDGICSIKVDDKWITAEIGGLRPPNSKAEIRGDLIGISFSQDTNKYIGKRVEVYAKQSDDNSFTIYGNENYYIKLLE